MSDLKTLVERLEVVAARLEKLGGVSAPATAAPAAAGEESPAVSAYDQLINDFVVPFVNLSEKIHADVKQAADLVKATFEAQRAFVAAASQCKKPDGNGLMKLFTPTNEAANKITAFRDKNRGPCPQHLNTLVEGIPALGWVTVEKTPVPYIKEMMASSEFWSNKILVQFKGKDQTQLDWVKAWKDLLNELASYVKQYHLTGFTYNPNGKDASQVDLASATSKPAAAAAAPAGGAPPPPPAPAPIVPSATTAPAGGMNAVFSAINSGNVTGGLRHVTKDMKTKNMADRTSVVPAKEAPVTTAKAPASKVKGTPRFELNGKKWEVFFQENNKQIVIEETELKQTVYIHGCFNSVIQVKGKVNSLVLDDCKKTGLVFENAVATCEFINCSSVEVQVKGTVPALSIDKSSGVQLYLSNDCLDIEIVTSKSDQMNVLVPDGDELTEMPIPEQYMTKFNKSSKKLDTTPSSHV